MILQLLEQLDTEVCIEAVDWLEESPGLSFEELWNTCERADWMLWFCVQIGVHHKSIVAAAIDCTARTLKYVPSDEARIDAVFEDLRDWLKGDIEDLNDAGYFAEQVATELLTDPNTTKNPIKATLVDAFYETALAVADLTFAAEEGPTIDSAEGFTELIDAVASAYAYFETSEIAVAVDVGIAMNVHEVVEDNQIAFDAVYDQSKAEELKALAEVIRESISWEEIHYKVATLEFKHFGRLQ